ncbi:MAG: 1-deoxy-D-xylulose-5-phosphate reductoisomerase, partial [Clostridia bacterium]|nr:1-deoxy-D-xylulose-5-phosphate reductoisomerase [Clostridia bacterium]
MRKNVLLLGASGSIGTQSLDIIEKYPDNFLLTAFSVGHKTVYIDAIMDRHPGVKYIYVIDRGDAWAYSKKYPNVKFFHGKTGLAKITKKANYDMCIDALVGFAGTEPAIIALKRNKILCLANKEALVTGGTLINKLLELSKGKLYPIDSEHVALAKCLSKCRPEEVKRLLITASGGALRNVDIDKLDEVKAEQALKHPTWKMGAKITIDSASVMNKGFGVIEARWLFGMTADRIEVAVHPQSIVHSAVEIADGLAAAGAEITA